MTDRLTITIEGMVSDQVANEVIDTISRKSIVVDLAQDKVGWQSLTADNVTEADLDLGALALPAVVLVWNRDPTNTLLVGPSVAGPALQRFIEVLPRFPWALFTLDSTTTLRYKSLVAPVDFFVRAWPI